MVSGRMLAELHCGAFGGGWHVLVVRCFECCVFVVVVVVVEVMLVEITPSDRM